MSKLDKLIARFLSEPAPKDFSWEDLVKLMKSYGYRELEGKGSRKKFVNRVNHKILLHKRHPDSTLLDYQIEDVKDALRQEGHI
ncbi:type II toxin-antitoxin system HicA family toxin [Stutzerimonas nitrititolerans]|uniref:type II toxin-antitoxin system HicA family toxin n=1 Tax=Stutzerimonas nitrititolerans TaxID=2482751 RepID=UPI0035E44767